MIASLAAALAATPPPARSPSPPADPNAGANPPVVAPAAKPLTLLDVALLAAERHAIPRMRREDNLTWQGSQLTALTRLLARAGRSEEALALIRDLDTPERVKVNAYAPIVVAALRAGDQQRARALTAKVAGIEEWTTPGTLAAIARGMDAAGDRAGALRLIATIPGGDDRAETLFEMGRYVEAIDAARGIDHGRFHVPCGEGHCWVEDWDQRQAFLLRLVKALVDSGDLRGAHAAAAALDEVEGFGVEGWQVRALVEMARREEPVATLQQALEALERAPKLLPGEQSTHSEVLAQIADGFAAAGERTRAVGLLPRARAALGPTDSAEVLEIDLSLVCAGLARIARTHFTLGQRDEALALLAHAERLADSWPVPPPKKSADSSWDHTASTQHTRVESKLRVAAALESGGEPERAEKTLAAALAEMAAIRNPEWRGYGWRSLVEAYQEVGRLDRAMELLTSGLRGDVDRWLAIDSIADADLLAAPRAQLWGLLEALPADGGKADFAARLAVRLDAQGERSSVTRLVTEAVAALAAMAAQDVPEWQLTLVALAGDLPSAERPGSAEQQHALRTLAAAVKAKANRRRGRGCEAGAKTASWRAPAWRSST